MDIETLERAHWALIYIIYTKLGDACQRHADRWLMQLELLYNVQKGKGLPESGGNKHGDSCTVQYNIITSVR